MEWLMNKLLIDSGFLYAALDKDDNKHEPVIEVLSSLRRQDTVLPAPIIVETTYLFSSRIGHSAMRRFVQTLDASPFELVSLQKTDTKRVHEILDQYSDLKLDFVDAAITALAERLNITRILTVDQRDFRVIKPSHCDHFEILPS